jgi:hypothetical protein
LITVRTSLPYSISVSACGGTIATISVSRSHCARLELGNAQLLLFRGNILTNDLTAGLTETNQATERER